MIIDAESVRNIIGQRYPIHREFHTFVGATLIAVGVILVARRPLSWASERVVKWFHTPAAPLGWPALIVGALFGAWSHIALDAIMHADMTPLVPWTRSNPLLGSVSLSALHIGCMVTGLVGLAGLWWRLRSRNVREA